jgi:hypothetical protein
MTVRKLHGIEKCAILTKMAVRKLHDVETDQDGFTQAAWCRHGPRWLYASCTGQRRTKMAVHKLHEVETDQDGCTQDACGRDERR